MNQFFDQRGQVVHGNQNNVVNFGSVQTKQDFAAQLETLRNEVAESVENGVLDQNTAIGVESHLEKAAAQVANPDPDKKAVLQNLAGAKSLIEDIAAASGLVGALAQAAQAVQKLIWP